MLNVLIKPDSKRIQEGKIKFLQNTEEIMRIDRRNETIRKNLRLNFLQIKIKYLRSKKFGHIKINEKFKNSQKSFGNEVTRPLDRRSTRHGMIK